MAIGKLLRVEMGPRRRHTGRRRAVSFVLIRPAQLPVLPVDTGGMPA